MYGWMDVCEQSAVKNVGIEGIIWIKKCLLIGATVWTDIIVHAMHFFLQLKIILKAMNNCKNTPKVIKKTQQNVHNPKVLEPKRP